MSTETLTLIFGLLATIGGAVVFLFGRLDRYVTRDEFKLIAERIEGVGRSVHDLRNQILTWFQNGKHGDE